MRKVKDMLFAAVQRDEVVRAGLVLRAVRDWESIVGPLLASRSWPDRYEGGAIWVAVEDSAWAQELRMRKDLLLSRIQERLEDPSWVTNLRFGVRPLPPRPETLPEPEFKEIETESNDGLSIREIAERRLREWNGEE